MIIAQRRPPLSVSRPSMLISAHAYSPHSLYPNSLSNHDSSWSLNRLPAQITTPTTGFPSSLQIMTQRVFPLGRPVTTVVTTLPAPATTKPTPAVGSPFEVEGFDCLNRNARRGKKANHGKRPVSSVRRKQKNRTFGRKNG